jgi:anti-anti-sigma regulatory factor
MDSWTIGQVEEGRFAAVLPPVLDARWAPVLRDAITGLPADAVSITLDAAEVQRVSTPVVQVMMAVHARLVGRGGGLRLDRPSAAIEAAFIDLGLHTTLDRLR